MSSHKRLKRIEYLVYAILLLVIVLAPTIAALYHNHSLNEGEFIAQDIVHTLKIVVVYVIAFAIHDVVIAPLLVYKHKPLYYVIGMLLLMGVFQLYQCNSRSHFHPRPGEEVKTEMVQDAPQPPSIDHKAERPLPPSGNGKIMDQPPGIGNAHVPPPFMRRDILALVMFLLGIGTNLGIKFYFRSIEARREMEDLEKVNLKQNLDQLRYQLHPHFFMNTLNNIHALVDIDPKKAQECIIDLSKLMRYILYETNHEYVQASREVEFMANYVRLMRIRYNDKLTFDVSNADDGKGVWIPPLIFISFVENAFKHGVNYNKPSFITISSKIYTSDNGEPRLLYQCRNSKRTNGETAASKKVSEASGVGLTNIRRRLYLLFGSNYTLDIDDGETEFLVKMDIPVKTSEPVS